MATFYCPTCSSVVRFEDDVCHRCGSDLSATITRGKARPVRDAARRLAFAPGYAFAGRFTIVEKVGEGGMGVVYKAIDTALNSEVALKLIQPTLASIPAFAERFRREVRLTRQITHSNVCRVHDIGEFDGILYLSMEWIEGETLQQLIQQMGRLKDNRALEIAEKIALALRAAHEMGIIHRDLKPGNVMIDTRGRVHVLDFGLALEPGSDDITESGVLVGSPHYMAPEQRRLLDVDHRADLYALGLILRDMLVGARLDPVPPLPPAVRSVVSPLILPILERLLAENREERYASASEARHAIQDVLESPGLSAGGVTPRRRNVVLWAGAVAVASAAVLGVLLSDSDSDKHEARALDPEVAAYYERGLHYLNDAESLREVDDAIQLFHRAQNLDPDSALIWAALADAFWYRFELTGEASSRDEAERAVANALQIDPSLPEVADARARGFMAEGKYDAARKELEKAVEAKPDFARAWSNLGKVRKSLGQYAAGLEAHLKAIELDPRNYRMHNRLGRFYEDSGEYDEASRWYQKAIDLKPDSGNAWNNLGASLLYTGRHTEAIRPLERSIEIEDRAAPRGNLGTALYSLGRHEEALVHYQRAAALEPNKAVHWGNLGDTLLVLGRSEQARAAYGKAADAVRDLVLRKPLDPDVRMQLAQYCAKARDEACALKEGDAAARMQPQNAKILFVNAVVRCRLGRDEESLDWLERAVKLGFPKAQIELEPELERLREHPRFKRILELAS